MQTLNVVLVSGFSAYSNQLFMHTIIKIFNLPNHIERHTFNDMQAPIFNR